MAAGYKYVAHTADVEFIARGKNAKELIRNSLLALFGTISDAKALSKYPSKVKKIKIKEKATTLEELLWRVLQDALSNSDANGIFLYEVGSIKLKKIGESYFFEAVCTGKGKAESFSKLDVKAVTKFGLNVRETAHGLSVNVVLDV